MLKIHKIYKIYQVQIYFVYNKYNSFEKQLKSWHTKGEVEKNGTPFATLAGQLEKLARLGTLAR